MRPIYITHASAVTPQHQSGAGLLQPLVSDTDCRLYITEPDYTSVIPAMQLRRMSRILKMGVYAGMDCIRQAGIERPDGIVTGTGKGSMTDTEKFVKELKQYNEEALNPTPFILSTYNAVNGAIALQTRATGYNQTYVHRGSSFEISLYDIQLKLHPLKDTQHYLAGCFDEITPEYFLIKDKISYWKKDRDTGKSLLEQSGSAGTIAGEGAAFFMLSNNDDHAIMAIEAIQTGYGYEVPEIKKQLQQLLQQQDWDINTVDMLVLGLNGDSNDQPWYDEILGSFAPGLPVMAFKHLCGEYETSGGFALWLCCQLLKQESLPEAIWYCKPATASFRPKRILYYNHYRGQNHNIILLSVPG